MPPTPIPKKDPEPTFQFLVELAERARDIHAGLPMPKRTVLAEDLSLRMGTSEEDRPAEEGEAERTETWPER